MSIRVAGGYLRGRILKTVPGRVTRPTTGRVREAIFSILQHDIEGTMVLDLFAGSGALAIEALSRGAASAILVEQHPKAVAVIKGNLVSCNLDSRLIAADYRKALAILSGEGRRFHLVFADPPYDFVDSDLLYRQLAEYRLFESGGFLILEHAGSTSPAGDNIIITRRFGDSAITIFAYDKKIESDRAVSGNV